MLHVVGEKFMNKWDFKNLFSFHCKEKQIEISDMC